MSKRTAEASKAVRTAWKEEQERVRVGKGTRDWTQKQQEEILEFGRAYYHSDDPNDIYDGKAFEGHHMKSVEAYPEFQGDSANIQFLSKPEHKEAHLGDYKNASNWYYDPVTHEFTDFGEGKYIPCEVINLSHPIITINVDAEKANAKPKEKAEKTEHGASPPIEEAPKTTSPKAESIKTTQPNSATTKPKNPEGKTGILSSAKSVLSIAGRKITSRGKKVVAWGVEHKKEIGTVFAFFTSIATTIAEVKKNVSNSESTGGLDSYDSHSDQVSHRSTEHKSVPPPEQKTTVEEPIRSSPLDHEVSKHSQRYHTKDGVVWKEKDPYHRGGKK